MLELRRRYPDWGARKLRVLLQREGIELARNTIHRISLRHDLIAAEDRHPPALERFERSAANELWQMDLKVRSCDRKVGPLSVIDDHSRYLIVLRAVESTHTEQVREPLRDAFCAHGVPEAMLMDHGTPWWSVQSTGGMTKLSLWLMQQGITLHWSRVRHPQTQGKVERFHGELQRALATTAHVDGGRPKLAGRVSLGTQSCAAARGVGDANAGQPLASELAARLHPNPPRWEYSAGAKVLKVDSQGKLTLAGPELEDQLGVGWGMGGSGAAWRVDAKSTTAAL